MSEVILTPTQKGRFEHHIKIGLIETLHKQGLLSDTIFVEAIRIQNEKDKQYFTDSAT
jgi:hypothetical protein